MKCLVTRSRSRGQKLWLRKKGLVTRNAHEYKYKSPIYSGENVTGNVKVFKSRSNFKVKVKHYGTMWNVLSQGQGHEVKNYGYARKVLSQEMHMSINIKALFILVRMLRAMLKFLKSRSNVKAKVMRSKIMVPRERSYHKEYTSNMKALPLLVRKLWPRLKLDLCDKKTTNK